jgi:two-component system CheB/CheR fusion protein
MAEHVLPRIIDEQQGDVTLRAWVAGCSDGRGSVLPRHGDARVPGDKVGQIPIQIFATDVSEDAVQRARAGAYPASIAADVSPERLRRFFTRIDGAIASRRPCGTSASSRARTSRGTRRSRASS